MNKKTEKKYCKQIVKKKTRCSRGSFLFGYCKQHLRIRILSTRNLIWSGVVFVFFIAGGYQDFIKPLYNSLFFKPKYIYCESDGRVRGVISGAPSIEGEIINFDFGIKEKKITISTIKNLNNISYCFDPIGQIDPVEQNQKFCLFHYKKNEKGDFFFTLDLRDAYGNLLGKIIDNEFVLNVGCSLSWNIDDTSFEVVDTEYNVLFSVEFKSNKHISVQGLFYNSNMSMVIGSDYICFQKEPELLKDCQKKLTKLFKYVGNNHFGTLN